MRKLSNQKPPLEYWQCIIPSVLSKYIEDHPSGESLYYHAKLVAEGFDLDLEDTGKQFRFARYLEATLGYLAHTQASDDFRSFSRHYIPITFGLVKAIDKLGPQAFALFFQQYIRFASARPMPESDQEMIVLVAAYVNRLIKKL